MNLKRIFLDWDAPLIPQLTDRLLATAAAEYVDLSDTLVLVPTVQSGRRLREALAVALADSNRGLFPPAIQTPDQILANAIKAQNIASEESMRAAWVTVFDGIDFEHFEALFPQKPILSTSWKLGMASRLMQLRSELSEEGLDFALAAQRAADAGTEPERWRQLARLEGLYIDELKTRDLLDPKQARRRAAESYAPPVGIRRICVIASPDPQPLPLQALARTADSIPVEVWIYGPDEALFDNWGRPLTEVWQNRALELEAWECKFHTVPDPKTTARSLAEFAENAAPESVLLGLADPALNASVSNALTAAGIRSYDPEGQPLHLGGVGRVAELLCHLAADSSIQTIRSLFQHPEVTGWLGSPNAAPGFLRAIDRLFEKHLAPDLDALIRFAARDTAYSQLHAALQKLKRVEQSLSASKQFAGPLLDCLKTIYQNKQIHIGGGENVPWKERADAVAELLRKSNVTENTFPQLGSEIGRESFRQSLKQARVHPDRPADAHDLLGWLELLWNDAPHLILAGLNESIVPESVVGDAFLPESLREQLGLRTNARRFARDAYLLEALCRRRAATHGRIDLLIPQTAADGTPLRPSRLLFLGAHETLLPRTRKLFRETERTGEPAVHTNAWKLTPPQHLPFPESLSVSALKSYLECPFRFFLRHILKMRPLDTTTRELSPAAFGNVFHDTVAELKGRIFDATTKVTELEKELLEIADTLIRRQYGERRSFALRLQEEALKTRIAAFCFHQVEDVKNHGSVEILETETDFDNFHIDGFPIKGRIDRIDRRDQRLELIDYKTSDTPKPPEKAHLAVVAKKAPPAHLPPEAFFEHNGKTHRWIDLQLPLYMLSRQRSGTERPGVAYFNLAKTADKSGIERWSDFSESHLESAAACATAVIAKIKAGIFWPPNPDVRETYDDFAALFPDGIENSVNPESFQNYSFESVPNHSVPNHSV